MNFPGFIMDVNPDDEAARLAAARKDAEARYTTATAACQQDGCLSGNAEGALYIAQLAGQAAQHAASTGHVVTVQISPEAAGPGDG